MPPSRRIASGPTAATRSQAKPGQQKLTFNNKSKVTKPGAKGPIGKEALSPASKKVLSESVKNEELPTPAPTSLPSSEVDVVEKVESESENIVEPPNPDDEKALKINKSQLDQYWKKKTEARKAPRVHQEMLSTEEKILREFDMDSRFGVRLHFHHDQAQFPSRRLAYKLLLNLLPYYEY